MKCLILAGGFGTRLYPLTINRAKALIQYKGKPLATHIVAKVPDHVDILVSINKKFEADFRQWQKSLSRQVEICTEDVWTEEQRKGAVGSLNFWVQTKRIAEDLLVIAGDNYFEFDLAEFIAAYNAKNALVAVYDIRDKSKARQFGVVQLDKECIVALEEKPAKPKSSLVATAIYSLPPHVFPFLSQYCSEGKKDNLGSFIADLIAIDQVHSYTFTELWLDIGSQIEVT
jgi:glucose-1-phosphate thymidylyltransferase